MAATEGVYPSPEARGRAVLVQNISPSATAAAIDDFFSFCGTMESKKLRTIPPGSFGGTPTLEAVVVFTDESARRTALMMNDSIVVDKPVSIVAVPAGFDFNVPVEAAAPAGAGLFGFLSEVAATVGTECKKAVSALDEATETGVLKAAKEQVVAVQQKAGQIANDIDDRYHVKNTILNVAENGKAQASMVAGAVATQTRSVATSVDQSLHLSEKTGILANQVAENETVKTAQRTISDGFQTLLSTAGLSEEATGTEPPAAAPAPETAQPASQSAAPPVS